MPDQLLHVGAPPLKSKNFVLSRILTDKLFGLRDDPPPFLMGYAPMFTPLECRLRADECQRMVAQAPNPRIRAILADMARTWTTLALETEQSLKENRPPPQLIVPNPLRPHA
jgi:hypothetical protein